VKFRFLHSNSEVFLLIFENIPKKISPPLGRGDKGEGNEISFVRPHPHPHPPPSKGEEIKRRENIKWRIN
jgi:hypothetical protein